MQFLCLDALIHFSTKSSSLINEVKMNEQDCWYSRFKLGCIGSMTNILEIKLNRTILVLFAGTF
jgi:hypothetical protein